MSARGFKLRSVIVWMGVVLVAAALLMGIVWKQYTYVNLSRALLNSDKDRARLQNEVMLLETQVRGLRQPSRLESLARDHFGLVDPGPAIVIQMEGQILASSQSDENKDNLKTASWKGLFKW